MDDRLTALEREVRALADAVRRLEPRVVALEGGAEETAAPAEARSSAAPPAAEVALGGFLALAGRSFLVLGGAFLIRAVTDAGSLPRLAGVLLGIAYSVIWIVLAERSGGRGETSSAAFHGLTAVLIGYPLLWEAVTRFSALSPAAAAALLAALTALFLAVAWRRDLHALAWTVTLASLTTTLALMVATRRIELFTLLLILFGVGVLWLTYGRRWHALRWPLAIGADLAVLLMTSLVARPGGPPEGYEALSPPGALALALGLFVVYVGSFAVRTLARGRDVTLFEAVQTVAVLMAGFGGAIRIANSAGFGSAPLGAAALVLAMACYGVAFAFVERRLDQRNFFFYTSLALVLTLSASGLVTGTSLLPLFWCLAGLAGALLGGRFGRVTLQAHSAVYLAAASLQTGLFPVAADAFRSAAIPPLPPLAVTAVAAAALGYAGLAATRPAGPRPWPTRLPALVLAVLALAGTATLVLSALARPVSGDLALVALIRTAILALAALGLAASRRAPRFLELTWLAYPVLLAGAAKLLLEDFPAGRPATLFPAFGLYGLALILVPRLLRAPADPPGAAGTPRTERT